MRGSAVILLTYLIGLGLLTSSCTVFNTFKYLNKKQINPIYISYENKSLIFVPIIHVGEERFYNSLKDSIETWKTNNYTVFYEQIIIEKEKISPDSMSYLQLRRKARKIIDLSEFTRKGYQESASRAFKNKTVQPEYSDIGITESDINADINLAELITEYERLYGTIQLDSCDLFSPIESNGTCRRLNNNLKPILYTYRNQELASQISESELNKIVIVYGASHIKPVIKILQSKNPNIKNILKSVNN